MQSIAIGKWPSPLIGGLTIPVFRGLTCIIGSSPNFPRKMLLERLYMRVFPLGKLASELLTSNTLAGKTLRLGAGRKINKQRLHAAGIFIVCTSLGSSVPSGRLA